MLSLDKKIFSLTHYQIICCGILVYGLVVILDPTNSIFHLKTVSFGVCMGLWLLFSKKRLSFFLILVNLICWLFLIYGNIISEIRFDNIDLSYREQINNLFFVTLLLYPLYSIRVHSLFKVIEIIGTVLSLVIIILFIAFLVLGLGPEIYGFFSAKSNNTIMIANRITLGIPMIMFFHKACPFMLFPLAISLSFRKKRRLLYFILYLFPLLIGGSRTPILCAFLLVIFYFYRKIKSVNKRIFILFVGLFSGAILLFNLITEAKSAEELKFGAADSYIESLFYTVSNIFIGKGIGGLVNIPTRGFVANSELSFFDLFNQYGVCVGFLFLLYLIIPGLILYADKSGLKNIGVAYILYLIIAGTNPLLFSSTGWFVWSVVCVISLKYYESCLIKK